MWIEKKDKKYYNDSKVKGLRLIFKNGITDEEKTWCKEFCCWLTKYYWFPIRCKIVFWPQTKFRSQVEGRFCYGIFYSNEEYTSRRYPVCHIASKFVKEKSKYDCLVSIAHELTHYYQWYFYYDKERSERSLEIIANKWAHYLVGEYLEEKNMKSIEY